MDEVLLKYTHNHKFGLFYLAKRINNYLQSAQERDWNRFFLARLMFDRFRDCYIPYLHPIPNNAYFLYRQACPYTDLKKC